MSSWRWRGKTLLINKWNFSLCSSSPNWPSYLWNSYVCKVLKLHVNWFPRGLPHGTAMFLQAFDAPLIKMNDWCHCTSKCIKNVATTEFVVLKYTLSDTVSCHCFSSTYSSLRSQYLRSHIVVADLCSHICHWHWSTLMHYASNPMKHAA